MKKVFLSFVLLLALPVVGWMQVIPLGEALDAPQFNWALGGNTPRGTAQNIVTHDGVDAYQTGNIGDDMTNIVQTASSTPIIGPGTLTFWWKVSSEVFDTWSFYLIPTGLTKGEAVATEVIFGQQNWVQVSIPVPDGSYKLLWDYIKDGSISEGSDTAWLDQVFFGPELPAITLQPEDIVAPVGSDVLFSVGYVAKQHKFFWQKNGTNLVGKTNETLSLTNVQLSHSGSYRVIITNSTGSVTSEVATLTVFQPVSLANGVDATNLVWTTFGTSPWFATNSPLSHDGIDVARGPHVPDEMGALESWIETRVNGPGTIKFWWKLRGLETDTLRFYVAGPDQLIVPPEDESWEQHTIAVRSGSNLALQWKYTREDFINTDDNDSAYLDQVVFIPATNSPPVFSFPSYSENGFSAIITHDPDRAYRIQGSTNLTLWTDVTNFNHTASLFQFNDPSGTNRVRRYYRVITP